MSELWTGTARPILPVAEMRRASAFYTSIGFDVESYGHGEYAFVRGATIAIDLSLSPDHDPLTTAGMIYVTVDDPDAVHARLARLDAPRLQPVENKPWGMREFAFTDPDNNLIRVGAPLT